MKFSVLISVYHRENPTFLDQALTSVENQTHCANEIVLVKDGPLTSELDDVIKQHIDSTNILYTILVLTENVGLGVALTKGIEQCKYEWIARMDSDDIALPDRFEKQFSYIEKNPDADIVGSWICEFDEDMHHCQKERKVPAAHDDLVKFAQYRNPLNHMTVIFKKSAVLDVGGYMPMNGFEDYYLWMRMILKGKQFANVSEVLLKARTGRGMISRRQGWQYAKDEVALEKAAYQLGFWSRLNLMRNLFTRVLPRLLPVFIVEKLYNLLRKF